MEVKLIGFLILYILLGFYMVITLIHRNRQNGFVGAYSGMAVGFLIYYAIIPFICLTNHENEQIKKIFLVGDNPQILYSIFITFLGFIVFNFMYRQTMSKEKVEKIKKEKKIDNKSLYDIFKVIAYLSFYAGALGCVVFFASFGGIANALNYAEYVRSFNNSLQDVVSYGSSLFLVIAKLVIVSPYAFLILIKENGKNKKYKIYFVISLFLTTMILLFNAGRTQIIYTLLSFAIKDNQKKIKKKWLLLILLGILALPLLDIFDSLFVFFQTRTWSGIKDINYINYCIQFASPFKNIIYLEEMNSIFGLRWGRDFITGILNLIPGVNFSVAYENTSLFMSGENWRILGGTPNDIITFSYIQFGIVGVILILGLVGYILGLIDKKLVLLGKGKTELIIQTIIALNMFGIVVSTDFEALIRNNFIITLLCGGLLLVKEKKVNKKDENIICDCNSFRV